MQSTKNNCYLGVTFSVLSNKLPLWKNSRVIYYMIWCDDRKYSIQQIFIPCILVTPMSLFKIFPIVSFLLEL